MTLSITTSSDPSGYEGAELTSDATGHFEVSLSAGRMFVIDTSGTGYYAPCPPDLDQVVKDTTVDIHLVPYSVLKSTGMPASLPTWYPRVSGKVFDGFYDSGVLVRESPVSGVTVTLSDVQGGVVRTMTVSDAGGHFVLCVPPVADVGQVAWLSAIREGLEVVSQPLEITGNDILSFDVGAAPGYWDY